MKRLSEELEEEISKVLMKYRKYLSPPVKHWFYNHRDNTYRKGDSHEYFMYQMRVRMFYEERGEKPPDFHSIPKHGGKPDDRKIES